MTNLDRIARNLDCVRQRVADAAARRGRTADAVQLVAVTKSVGDAEIHRLAELGVTHVGENRVNAAALKRTNATLPLTWHMIGNIQRRKAPDVVRTFDVIEAVDRIELAEALQTHCAKQDKRLPIYIEVNVSGEPSKHGLAPAELAAAIAKIREYDRLDLLGLMTMAPLVVPEAARPIFARLAELASQHTLRHLSMGMSNDFEIAIEEGATQVRIGSALFE